MASFSSSSSSSPSQQGKRRTSRRSTEPPLRILCFGDSLTSGYPVDRPYAGRLAAKIEAAFPGRRVECTVQGLPGDLVTDGQFLDRMRMSWVSAQHPYDWTIVLGGTNDLSWSKLAGQIIEGLQRVWNIPLAKGGNVLALTIPENERIFPPTAERRDEVNDYIRNHKAANYFHFDLSNAVPYHDMTPEERDKYWYPDGAHLQAPGYDLMGDKVGEALVRILRLAEAQGTDISSVVSNARQRKAIEDLIFQEEMGDPRLLSQGYIIVRKKDLD